VRFRIALGGATGHKAFARDLGVLVKPEEVNRVVCALVRVFIAKGNRGDRKKARLKHLLEKMSLAEYLAETEKLLGGELTRARTSRRRCAGLRRNCRTRTSAITRRSSAA
jgi:ferredoxin-nitrite reductase